MKRKQLKWTKFYREDVKKHNEYVDKKTCSLCKILNSSYGVLRPSDIIEISDDFPYHSNVLFHKGKSVRDSSTLRFQIYNQKSMTKFVRQSSIQIIRNINVFRIQSKITEVFVRTNVTL